MLTTCPLTALLGQGEDSLVVARRVVAAAALAAKEYAVGVTPHGEIVEPQEVDESKQFLDEAILDIAALPLASRAVADTGLRLLRQMLERTAPPDSVAFRTNTLVQRIAALSGGTLEAYPSRPPSRARGEAVYREQCIQCHGAAGRGDGPKARHLTGPPAADLGDEASLRDVSPEDMYRKIAIGVAGTGMPEYAAALSSEDRWALTAYIMTFRADKQRVREGEGLYAAQCSNCHGSTGRGDGQLAGTLSVSPPGLADLAVQARLSDAALADLIRDGRPGTPMPGFARQLGPEEIRDIVAYVRVLPLLERHNASSSPQASVFSAVRRQIDSAIAMRSSKIAFDAYLTFEQVETDVRARNAALTGDLEDAFAALRARAPTASSEDLAALRGRLLSGLERAERTVADQTSTANLFAESFFLLLREGFEAILIIGALMAFLARAGAAERRRDVAKGAWAAVAASLATAVVVEMLFEVTPGQREAIEGATMLLATGVLFYVSYWLFSKIEVAKWNAFVKGRMADALSRGSSFALASVAFLAVYREGFETILFYKALLTSAGSGVAGGGGGGGTTAVVAGVLAGSVALVGVYLAINRFGLRIPMRPFFAVTSTMLYYMAFVFAGKGIADLQEAGVVPMTVLEWAPRVPVLGIYPTLESLALQGLLIVLLLFALAWLERDRRLTSREPVSGRA